MAAEDETYLLIAFGDIEGANTTIQRNAVFNRLFDSGLWYTTRKPRIPDAR
jgi:hypothetical protein